MRFKRRIDLRGKTFGVLRVIDIAPSRKVKTKTTGYWLVRCDCGREKEMQAAHVMHRQHKICGMQCGLISTVRVDVRCSECERMYSIQRRTLLTSDVRRCGRCVARQNRSSTNGRPAHNRLPGDEGSFNGLFTRYRLGAADRGMSFELSRAEFRRLTKLNCYFCGAPPSQIAARSQPKGAAPLYVYNGIDRIDSSLGHEPGNVLPCCGICNRMKGDMPLEEFLARVKLIHDARSKRALLKP